MPVPRKPAFHYGNPSKTVAVGASHSTVLNRHKFIRTQPEPMTNNDKQEKRWSTDKNGASVIASATMSSIGVDT